MKTISLTLATLCFGAATGMAQLVSLDFETPGDLENNFTAVPGSEVTQTHFIPDPRRDTFVYNEDLTNTYVQQVVSSHFVPFGHLTYNQRTFQEDIRVSMDVGATFSGSFTITLSGIDQPVLIDNVEKTREIIMYYNTGGAGTAEEVLWYATGLRHPEFSQALTAPTGIVPTDRASEFDAAPPAFFPIALSIDLLPDGSSNVEADINGTIVFAHYEADFTPQGAFTVTIGLQDVNTQVGGSYIDNFAIASISGIAAVPESDFTGALLALGVCGLIVVSAARKRGAS